jgi:hypothetical protein
LDHLLDCWPLLTHLVPAFSYQIFNLIFDLVGKLGPKALLYKLGLDVLEGQLSVLPILGDNFIEDDTKRIDIC